MRNALLGLILWLICLAMVIYIAYTYSTRNIEPVPELKQASEIITPIAETTQVEQDKPQSEYLGEFTVTAYCSCKKCCGKQTGITKSGTKAIEGVTIGTDWGVIPNGATVEIEGLGVRVAQDTGGAIKGKRIDFYMQHHSECLEFGVKKLKVWRLK